jgi:integrase
VLEACVVADQENAAMTIRVVEHQGGWLQVDIRVRLPDGTRYRERLRAPVQSKSGARRWAEQRERYLALHGPEQPKKEVPTLEEFESRFFSEHVEANQLKPSTAHSYRSRFKNHLRPTLGRLRLDQIDKQAEQRLKAAMRQFDPGTINDTLGVLSRLLNCAVEWGVIKSAPRFAKLKTRQAEIEFFDFDDFERLVDGARKVDPSVLAFVLLAGEAGLRRGEIIALDLTDADFKRGQLTIARSDWCGHVGTTKGGKTRRVPMTTRLTEALQAIRHLRGVRMLYQRDGEAISENTLRSWMERAERAAGLKVTGHIHQLRHTFCSHLAMRGAPAKAIQELAGHADLTTTMRYMHLSPASLNQAIRLLEQRGAIGGNSGATTVEKN